MSQGGIGKVVKDSFVIVGSGKAQGGFTVYKIRLRVSVRCQWSRVKDVEGVVDKADCYSWKIMSCFDDEK